MRGSSWAAHDADRHGANVTSSEGSEGVLVETVIGIVLIVISAVEIAVIVREVQANMGRA